LIVEFKSHCLESLRLGEKIFFFYNYKVTRFRSGTNYIKDESRSLVIG